MPPDESIEASKDFATLVAVCGLHMRGYPLEKQMVACGARFVREAETAATYEWGKLPTVPAKPGLITSLLFKIKIAPDVFAALNYQLHRRLKTIALIVGLFLDTSRRQKINCDNPETKSASLADSSSI